MTTHRYNPEFNDSEAWMLMQALTMLEEDALKKRRSDMQNYEQHDSRAEAAFKLRIKICDSAKLSSYPLVNPNESDFPKAD